MNFYLQFKSHYSILDFPLKTKTFMLAAALLTFVSYNVFSQDLQNNSITMHAFTSVNGNEFFISTICDQKEIMIRIKSRDSILINNLRSDRIYNNVSEMLLKGKFDAKNDTVMKLLAKMDSITKANTVYSVDSLKIYYNQFPKYEKLLGLLFNSSLTDLENNAKNKARVILDGTRMEFKLYKNNSIQFTAYAHSPRQESHPLLYEYLKSTIEIYRKSGRNNLLTVDKTSGY